jgi:hypothetical protein
MKLNFLPILLLLMLQSPLANADALRLQRDGPIARDYMKKLEWMRCSIGQVWEEETCIGEVKMLSVAEAEEIIERIEGQMGGGWRLPTTKELRSLISDVELPPKIDVITFPVTYAGSYWSSDQSFYAKHYQWTVNFYTGHLYNRFFRYQKNAVRLVRNYTK